MPVRAVREAPLIRIHDSSCGNGCPAPPLAPCQNSTRGVGEQETPGA